MLTAQSIKKHAANLGFDACGIAKVRKLSSEIKHYQQWLDSGHNAGMGYMHNYPDIRENPQLLLENAQSIIITLNNYYPTTLQRSDAPQVAKYAYGKDYHKVLLKKHKALLACIGEHAGCKGRIFVDSAPVLERAWAVEAGLGWIGKSSMLISPTLGTHTLISGMVIDVEVDAYDRPINESCGSCTRCVDHCPTGAITSVRTVNAGSCLSYLSIEHRGKFEEGTHLHNSVFGCDRCVDICPFSKKKAHAQTDFFPKKDWLSMTREDWSQMNKETFNLFFSSTALKRTKFEGIKRNLAHL